MQANIRQLKSPCIEDNFITECKQLGLLLSIWPYSAPNSSAAPLDGNELHSLSVERMPLQRIHLCDWFGLAMLPFHLAPLTRQMDRSIFSPDGGDLGVAMTVTAYCRFDVWFWQCFCYHWKNRWNHHRRNNQSSLDGLQ